MKPAKRPEPVKLPDCYFDNRTEKYWFKLDCGEFLQLGEGKVKRHFRRVGLDTETDIKAGYNKGDDTLAMIQINNFVHYAAPLAGHKLGLLETSAGWRVLVTTEIKPPAPGKSSDCPWFDQFFFELLGEDQTDYVLAWLKTARESLLRRDFRPGHLLAVFGPSGCGKSLLHAIITAFLGGRSAKPYRYMIGDTNFNADLSEAEHLVIEDEAASTSIQTRRDFGIKIKDFTVNSTMSVHPKGKQAFTLQTFKRLSLSANDEPENLMIMPPMDESIMDKVIMLKCGYAKLSPDRDENWRRVTKELPNLIRWLEKWRIPKRLTTARNAWEQAAIDRFGFLPFHHPELIEIISEVAPETRLLNLIDEVLFTRRTGESWDKFKERTENGWTGSAMTLEQMLTQSAFAFAAQKLFYYSSACGVYLGRLEAKFPHRFHSKKVHGQKVWEITKQTKGRDE